MFQGASVAFDLSMEEIWIPYLVGASLFVATREILGEADALPDVLTTAGVTVLDTVPTLLGLLSRDIPSLRLIILGGEACPPSLGARWCRPGRTIYNSYGPTEATVVATAALVEPGEPVTIGGPIPNYTCYVVDEALKLLDRGQEGELLIGGPGVARGYLKRDALTAEKFVANPFRQGGADPILYRSGDAVALDPEGRILFRGRIDDQVKLRGFRIELGEIESTIAGLDGVHQAAVVLRHDDGPRPARRLPGRPAGRGARRPDAPGEPSRSLPPYMVPSRFEPMEVLPRLASGKVDRNALKRVALAARTAEAQEEPRTPTEGALLDAARAVLPAGAIPFDADFFTDLGGHSLLAARFVSVVRQTPSLAAITLQDMYRARTLRGDRCAGRRSRAPRRGRPGGSRLRAAAAAAPLPLRPRPGGGPAGDPVLRHGPVAGRLRLLHAADHQRGDLLGGVPLPRRHLHGDQPFHARLRDRLQMGDPRPHEAGALSPLGNLLLSLVARAALHRADPSEVVPGFAGDAALHDRHGGQGRPGRDHRRPRAGALDLIEIGPRASIGGKVKFANARVEGGEFIVGRVTIGADAYVGTSCVIEEGVTIGDFAEMGDLCAVSSNTAIAAREIWDGSPARKVGDVDLAARDAYPEASAGRKAALGIGYVAMLLVIPPLGLLPIFRPSGSSTSSTTGCRSPTSTASPTSCPCRCWPGRPPS